MSCYLYLIFIFIFIIPAFALPLRSLFRYYVEHLMRTPHETGKKTESVVSHFLTHAVERVYPSANALAERLSQAKPIRAYLGVDPSGQTLHLGHAIVLKKLGELQALGHDIVLLIGDFTAMIGDPTDKSATRQPLTRDQVASNAKLYQTQASRFIRFDEPHAATLAWNSAWLNTMTFADVVTLASHFTVQQMLERDMFEKRIIDGKPVHLHEFLYPLMQGYDTVALDVDLEIGGNDQTFNMLAGRTLMREMRGKEKMVMTVRLLADPTGKKMGKSEGNMIALSDTPEDMYGKIMSWPDTMILTGFENCTDATTDSVDAMRKQMDAGENPMTFKHELARQIVTWLAGEDAAERGAKHFSRVHQDHEAPTDIPVTVVSTDLLTLVDALVVAKLVTSKTDARRQIEQGAVSVDERVVRDVEATVSVSLSGTIIQKGKRHFARLRVDDRSGRSSRS